MFNLTMSNEVIAQKLFKEVVKQVTRKNNILQEEPNRVKFFSQTTRNIMSVVLKGTTVSSNELTKELFSIDVSSLSVTDKELIINGINAIELDEVFKTIKRVA